MILLNCTLYSLKNVYHSAHDCHFLDISELHVVTRTCISCWKCVGMLKSVFSFFMAENIEIRKYPQVEINFKNVWFTQKRECGSWTASSNKAKCLNTMRKNTFERCEAIEEIVSRGSVEAELH